MFGERGKSSIGPSCGVEFITTLKTKSKPGFLFGSNPQILYESLEKGVVEYSVVVVGSFSELFPCDGPPFFCLCCNQSQLPRLSTQASLSFIHSFLLFALSFLGHWANR